MITTILRRLGALAASRRGATAIEYAILAALIAGAVIVAVGNIGTKLSGVFSNISNSLNF